MRGLHITALVLTIIGALNWGLVGLFSFDLVAALFGGSEAALSRIVYLLVGLAGLVLIVTSYSAYTGVPLTRTTTAGTTTGPTVRREQRPVA